MPRTHQTWKSSKTPRRLKRQETLSLLGIPPELRLIIFEEVFHLGHAVVTGRAVSRPWALQKCKIEPAKLFGLPSLFMVNRQCYDEARKPFLRNCTFHFMDFMRLEEILHSAGPSNAQFMRSVSIQVHYATNIREIRTTFPELRKLTVEASTLYDLQTPLVINEKSLARHILGQRLRPDFVESMTERFGGRLRWEEKMAIQLRLNPVRLDICFHWDYVFPSRRLLDVAVGGRAMKCLLYADQPS